MNERNKIIKEKLSKIIKYKLVDADTNLAQVTKKADINYSNMYKYLYGPSNLINFPEMIIFLSILFTPAELLEINKIMRAICLNDTGDG